ncbi:alanine racemase [Clostridium thermarum]|uniref:alanine racemase n=1 Tax=Clostridium thermarum TaxID=1716543 RepID=UPI0013D4A2E1|nr:alanine racemase [Clostridium thermarum]
MTEKLRPLWAEVNLDNIAHNMREVRRISASKEIIAVIKADAYGHGALEVAPVLIENGATRLAVAVVTEALELRRAVPNAPIMILGYTPVNYAEELIKNNIEVTVYNYEYVEALSKEAEKFNGTVKVHIAVDTGMGRIGFLPNDNSANDVYKISKLSNIIIESVFSHFSCSDEKDKEYTIYQFEKFNWFCDRLKEKGVKYNFRHIANSGAIIDMPSMHLDAVRPGILLYGYYPSDEVQKDKINIKPAMSLKASIINIKRLPAGEYISYGRTYRTERESVIATLPIGYADGYTRLLFNKGKVIVNGCFVPIVGRICMDMCMIDVTGIDGLKIGDEVIIMGEDKNIIYNADDIAKHIGTINYEVICAVSKRVPRVYIKDDKVVEIRNYIQ